MTPEQIRATEDELWRTMEIISKHAAPSPLPASVEEAVRNAAKEILKKLRAVGAYTLPWASDMEVSTEVILKHLAPILAQSQPVLEEMERWKTAFGESYQECERLRARITDIEAIPRSQRG